MKKGRIGKGGREERAQCARGEDEESRGERQREERRAVTDSRSRDTGPENKVSIFSCSSFFFFFLSISLSSNSPPPSLSSSGLKSDIHHSRVPQTIYLECRRHENR